ncbi:MAG: tyrosine-type recombinase/integrase [Planctomycetota bacterium]
MIRYPAAAAPRPSRVWEGGWRKHGEAVRVLKADLNAAGIPFAEDEGRTVDFHALRHTYITNVVRGGANVKDAQTLARHSTVTLTIDRYAHAELRDLRNAVESLPTDTAAESCRRSAPTDAATLFAIAVPT